MAGKSATIKITDLRLNENAVMIILATCVGILGGYGAVVFRWLISFFQQLFFGHGRDHFLEYLFTIPWYAKLVPPITGVMFAMEIILGEFGVNTFSPIVVSSVMATVISRAYLGNFPAFTATSGAYSLVGMGAVLAATTQGPISAIIILFEMTGSYKIILPLMLSCIISAVLSGQIKKESIYTLKLIRRGIDIRAGRDVNVMQSMFVKDAMTKKVVAVPLRKAYGKSRRRKRNLGAVYLFFLTNALSISRRSSFFLISSRLS